MDTRSFARTIRAIMDERKDTKIIERLDKLTISFPIALRHQCQKTRMDKDIQNHLLKEDADIILDTINPANMILLVISRILGEEY